ncbi:MAG TPA: lysine biosynthesis protein LysW [Dehalococcoidia bacterium]|nr:lysine biosynthesis protein LysW [Dehalococcoidia bacterium]
MRYWLKNCPRCHGDLREESDVYGAYIACVQCGYILRAEEEERLVAAVRLEPAPIHELAA